MILHYGLMPDGSGFTASDHLTIMGATVVWFFSLIGLFVWIEDVRAFYRNKNDPLSIVIKIITFPIWLLGLLLGLWGAYETAKGVRNWLNKND